MGRPWSTSLPIGSRSLCVSLRHREANEFAGPATGPGTADNSPSDQGLPGGDTPRCAPLLSRVSALILGEDPVGNLRWPVTRRPLCSWPAPPGHIASSVSPGSSALPRTLRRPPPPCPPPSPSWPAASSNAARIAAASPGRFSSTVTLPGGGPEHPASGARPCPCALAGRPGSPVGDRLDLPARQAPPRRPARRRRPARPGRRSCELVGGGRRQLAPLDLRLHRRGQVQQRQGPDHARLGMASSRATWRADQPLRLHQGPERLGLLDRLQVLPQAVLDELDRQQLGRGPSGRRR